ncbi:MAG: hypothetical protein ACI9UQ_001625, partial [Candidatus Krumholzibacteriia bacterium]
EPIKNCIVLAKRTDFYRLRAQLRKKEYRCDTCVNYSAEYKLRRLTCGPARLPQGDCDLCWL